MARFVADVVRLNGVSDGVYVEPYAGGAAVALELLISGVVRRVAINDISVPIFEFWRSVLFQTNELINLILDTEISVENWLKCKEILSLKAVGLNSAFAMFFLNRTNRSGILNGGIIGGKHQTGTWKIDARFNKDELIERIERISRLKKRITVTNLDALRFLEINKGLWTKKTLVYFDPPYYNKGRDLYYDFYKHDDHVRVAQSVQSLRDINWIVSYDDVDQIRNLYGEAAFIRYTIGYSARDCIKGDEAMFFGPGMEIPPARGPMVELRRSESTV